MSTRKLGVALGAAVLLLGTPMSFALAGQGGEGKGGDKPEKALHECEDGEDNDTDGLIDFAGGDSDCGSPRDNSEGPDDVEETPEQPGLPPELQAVIDELTGGGEPPAELQGVIDQVTGALGGGEDPGEEEPCETEGCEGEGEEPSGLPVDPTTLPVDPTTLPGEVQGAVQAIIDDLPPADPAPLKDAVQPILEQLPPEAAPVKEAVQAVLDGLPPA